jgi:hypothetical protein
VEASTKISKESLGSLAIDNRVGILRQPLRAVHDSMKKKLKTQWRSSIFRMPEIWSFLMRKSAGNQ